MFSPRRRGGFDRVCSGFFRQIGAFAGGKNAFGLELVADGAEFKGGERLLVLEQRVLGAKIDAQADQPGAEKREHGGQGAEEPAGERRR